MPHGAPVEEMLSVAVGGMDSYDFHALETIQCMAERRAGGETGVAAVQGLLWQALGVDMDSACRMAAHGLATGLLGAALRLGIIGHVDSQAILGRLHAVIEDILSALPLPLNDLHAYAPAADIAMMRHENQESRLFYN